MRKQRNAVGLALVVVAAVAAVVGASVHEQEARQEAERDQVQAAWNASAGER